MCTVFSMLTKLLLTKDLDKLRETAAVTLAEHKTSHFRPIIVLSFDFHNIITIFSRLH